MTNSLFKISSLLLISSLFIKCDNSSKPTKIKTIIPEESNTTTETAVAQKNEFSVKIIDVNDKQFGYDILMNGQPYIHQPHIPAIGGNNGFSSKEKAEIAGDYIIQKLNNNIIPPTISLSELDSLKVLN